MTTATDYFYSVLGTSLTCFDNYEQAYDHNENNWSKEFKATGTIQIRVWNDNRQASGYCNGVNVEPIARNLKKLWDIKTNKA